MLGKIHRYVLLQLKISFHLVQIAKIFDVIFVILGSILPIPILLAKILGKKIVLITTGSEFKIAQKRYEKLHGKIGITLARGVRITENICYALSDHIVVDSEKHVYQLGLNKYKRKIVCHDRYINHELFKIIKKIDERDNLVGYIGRFGSEKGTINFLDALSTILKEDNDVKALICGDGELLGEIKEKISNFAHDKIILTK